MADRYPRVLIIGQDFNRVTGGGITLSNLFTGWPKDRIAVASVSEYVADKTICEQYYRLGALEDRWVWPLSYIKRTGKDSRPAVINHMASRQTPVPPSTAPSFSGARGLFYWNINLWGVHDLLNSLFVSPQFLAWIRGFQPDVIYTQLSTLPLIRLTDQVFRHIGGALVVHMMDDWPSTIYQRGLLSPYMRRQTDRKLRMLLTAATVRMAISHKMAKEFEKRYGRPFLTFHNAIDISVWLQYAKQDWRSSNPFRMVYAGRIGQANQSSLQAVCHAVSQLCDEGRQIRLDLYTGDADAAIGRQLASMHGISVHAAVPYPEVPALFASADLLVLPLDFDDNSVRFARYSMPTKTPEYMISGAPTLIHAPPDLAVSEYARVDGWGYLVSAQGPKMLSQSIVHIMEDQSLREHLGRRAQALAIQNHNAIHVREAFRAAMWSALRSDHASDLKSSLEVPWCG